MRAPLFALLLALAFPLAGASAQAQGRSDRDDQRDRDDRRERIERRDDRRDDRRDRDDRWEDRRDRDDRYDDRYRRTRLDIPPGHLPPRGECRLWYYDRPPGHQPAPEQCERLRRYRSDDAVVIDHEGRIVGGRYDRRLGDVLEGILFPRQR